MPDLLMNSLYQYRWSFILSFIGFSLFAACKKDSNTNKNADTHADDNRTSPLNETALAFPGAEGFGKDTKGGRGGKVIKVTNLNDSGAGSLRAAIESSGPRIVVFEVSGNIQLKSRLQIKNGNLTIAGQTAPGDGICIQNYEVNVDADEVIIRFLRFRMGDLMQQETDALWGRYHKNIIIDHCSMSWSVDECSSFYSNQNFTMQWCLLAESLNQSFHGKGDHGYGAIWGGSNASFHHNLLANHNSRNPRFNGGGRSGMQASPFGPEVVDFTNNVIYNWGMNSTYGGENGQYNMVNNYYKAGPGTRSSVNRRIVQVSMDSDPIRYAPGYGSFYLSGNYVYNNAAVSANNWSGGVDYASGVNESRARVVNPFNVSAIRIQTAEQAFLSVLAYAGASFKRDAVDSRVAEEVRTGTSTYAGSKTGLKGIIDSQTDVGGWPALKQEAAMGDTDSDGMPDEWERLNGLDPAKNDANGRDLSTGYDNIEVYINSLVKKITDAQL